jgi:hypothetical protein
MKRAINLQLTLKQCGDDPLKLISKFFKKHKKSEIIQDYVEKTSFYETRSQKKRRKIRENKFFRDQEVKQELSFKKR